MSPKRIEQLSKQSKERDRAIKLQQQKFRREQTRNEVTHVVHQTRPKKLAGATDERVRAQHLEELGFFDKRTLRKVVQAANGRHAAVPRTLTPEDAARHGTVLEKAVPRQATRPPPELPR